MTRPTEPGASDAPMTAIEDGSKAVPRAWEPAMICAP
jgi:hypothetical protein